ncbi:hypothetical protein B0E43_13135 [Algoriphagus sp. A40]|nr:hypothetical protein B0E43_13135 [Algoriphagus sp. A40]
MKPESFEFKPGTVEFLTFKDRPSMKLAANSGQVAIKGLNFKDGTIEFDVESILPGFAQSVYFHKRDEKEQEIVYLRLGKIGDIFANEAVQYCPYFDGVNMWDMYPNYQAPALIEKDDWNHIKLVIHGKRMQVFVNDDTRPVLDIPKLEGNYSEGGVSFEGASYISNISIRPNDTGYLTPEEAPDLTDHQSNYLREWAITEPSLLEPGREVTRDQQPDGELFKESITAERDGLINLTRKFGMNQERKVVWLKAVIESATAQANFLDLGFSDEVWVFLNGQMVWVDKNLFQQDMSKYPKGRISIANTRIPLNLKQGKNELTLAVANDFYGWGIIAHLGNTDGILAMEKFTPPPVVPIEDINQYLGVYSSQTAPVKLTFTSENGRLIGKAGDQPSLTFSYRGNHVFEHVKENLKLTFNPSQNSLVLFSGGQEYKFTKE